MYKSYAAGGRTPERHEEKKRGGALPEAGIPTVAMQTKVLYTSEMSRYKAFFYARLCPDCILFFFYRDYPSRAVADYIERNV